jgi:hypothetical protein
LLIYIQSIKWPKKVVRKVLLLQVKRQRQK